MSEGIKIEREAVCPYCNYAVAVTKRGTLKLHTRSVSRGRRSTRRKCIGSAMPVPPGAVAERLRWLEASERRDAERERSKAAALLAEAETHGSKCVRHEAMAKAYAAALAKEVGGE